MFIRIFHQLTCVINIIPIDRMTQTGIDVFKLKFPCLLSKPLLWINV